MATIFEREKNIERFLRKRKWLLLSITFLTAASLYAGIAYCMILFKSGHTWTIFPAGLLAHSFFVITMHDGAHKSITKTKFDYFMMNFCSGLIILPAYTELFKKFHLLHHANTNTAQDPLWSEQKTKLFNEKRFLYTLLQCLPFAFNLAIVFGYKEEKRDYNGRAPRVNMPYILMTFVIATGIVLLTHPPLWFVLGTFTFMTTLGAIRYWGEHMGIAKEKESNTHWFPLGMGIGNHEVHHHYPGYSWLTLTIGLLFRKKDTNPFKSLYGIYFDKSYRHYGSLKK
jgi:fatty acid desaturase